MIEVAGRHALFSGCAYGRNGEPARQATIALAKGLHIDLWEAPDTGCCGARADRRVDDEARRKTLTPLYEGTRQGLDIVCLSPACRNVVAAYTPPAGGLDQSYSPRVRDVIQLAMECYGRDRLAESAHRALTGLRVAIHATCHANHNALVRRQFVAGSKASQGLANVTALLTGSMSLPRLLRERGAVVRSDRPADPAAAALLSGLMQTIGATATRDVSLAGRCAEVALPMAMGLRGRMNRRARPSPCLELAARAGANVLVTPCFLCFIGLNNQQSALPRTHPARDVPVLHVSQLAGVACAVSPKHLELTRTAVSARRALNPFVV